MLIRRNISLAPYLSMRVPLTAREFVVVRSVADLDAIRQYCDAPYRVLGGGSNVVPVADVDGTVIHICIEGMEVIADDGNAVTVRVGAGEQWHGFVEWCVNRDFGGLENLALIPGTVGAAPMQNIGAYGVEQSRCFLQLECFDIRTGERHVIDASTCRFGYRDSIFKQEWRDVMVITSVTYMLQREAPLVTDYADVRKAIEGLAHEPTRRDVFDAVVAIRTAKLPNPSELPNSGSFFKNPVVDAAQAEKLLLQHPTMPQWPVGDGRVKLAAAWLIDQCGWKGHRRNGVGVHTNQALVIVNAEGGTGSTVWQLAMDIQRSVADVFGVELEAEVNRWD
jgi:UDP-N-acetylmuramate dehydrogenase